MSVFWLRHQGTCFPVRRGPNTLGRSPKCWLVLSAPRISREHARVRLRRGQLTIEDLGSRNGTRVNGVTVSELVPLQHGDVIELGSEVLHVIECAEHEAPQRSEGDATLSELATMANETVDEPAARAQRQVLELAEELLLRGSRSSERDAIGQTICAMVDTLVSDFERAGNRLTPGEAVRLSSVSQIAAQWAEAPEARDWSAQVLRTLGPDD